MPGRRRGPRSTARSRLRAARSRLATAAARRRRADASAARAASPPRSPSSAVSATSRARMPGGVRASGRPAESSTSIPQRLSSTATRRARPRSGVTSAATLSGVSAACRRRTAMRKRFLALVRCLEDPDAGNAQPAFSSRSDRQLAPALGRARRAHRLGYETIARAQRRASACVSGTTASRATPILCRSSFRPYCG